MRAPGSRRSRVYESASDCSVAFSLLASPAMGDAEGSMPAWERRFRAPVSYLPEWSPHAPGAVVYTSNESGSWQAHAWDASTGERRQVTEDSVGVIDATPTLDGRGVVWFQDETGSEAGRWVVQPFGGGEPHPFLGFPTAGARAWHRLPGSWPPGSAPATALPSMCRSTEHRRPRCTDRRSRSGSAAWTRVDSCGAGSQRTDPCSVSSMPSTVTSCIRRCVSSIRERVRPWVTSATTACR